MQSRRQFLNAGAAGIAATALAGCAAPGPGGSSRAKVVVVGGGFAGATVSKYIRMWGEGRIDVTLIEPNAAFVSCPISNLVIGGVRGIDYVTMPYDGLQKNHGVRIVRGSVARIDPSARRVVLEEGSSVGYDRLVVAPGIDFIYEALPGLNNAAAQAQVMHAWKAGAQTVTLRRQLEAMPNGGVFAIAIPLGPYRCPPGPYERICQIAAYFKREKPRSKVLVLDANEKIVSKGKLFAKAWADRYQGIIEYRTGHALTDVDVQGKRLLFEFQDPVKADVLNVIPAMRAGRIARSTGLANLSGRWCEVDFLTFESKVHKNIHVLGDSIQGAPSMPKSGHMANQQAKVAAAAIVAELSGQAVNDAPVVMNTCYSFVSEAEVVHVASVHQWVSGQRTFIPVEGAGGLSSVASEVEGQFAHAWARNIWADTLT